MFTVLSSSGLSHTRLGVVLSSAAMIDDVIGLVMVQVASELGGSRETIAASTTLRPILVSLAFAVVTPLLCRYVLCPSVSALCKKSWFKDGGLEQNMHRRQIAWILQTTVLVAFVTGASYAGTSNLFAAYLCGVLVTWWDQQRIYGDPDTDAGANVQAADDTRHIEENRPGEQGASRDNSSNERSTGEQQPTSTCQSLPRIPQEIHSLSGLIIYEHYCKQTVDRILKPMFFASIGFSIPISNMFVGSIVWKGIVYSILMALGKLFCGIWLVRMSMPVVRIAYLRPKYLPKFSLSACFSSRAKKKSPSTRLRQLKTRRVAPEASENPQSQTHPDQSVNNSGQPVQASQSHLASAAPEKPISLYPATILGCAMVARGEIGFLISSIAQSKGIFESQSPGVVAGGPSEIFLIVTWAIVLCTLFGPIGVGALVRRMKGLKLKSKSNAQGQEEGTQEFLGAWGVTQRSKTYFEFGSGLPAISRLFPSGT